MSRWLARKLLCSAVVRPLRDAGDAYLADLHLRRRETRQISEPGLVARARGRRAPGVGEVRLFGTRIVVSLAPRACDKWQWQASLAGTIPKQSLLHELARS